jgi:hypothetical protein
VTRRKEEVNNPLHDLACLYLSEEAQLVKLCRLFPDVKWGPSEYNPKDDRLSWARRLKRQLEAPSFKITVARNRSTTILGYVDLACCPSDYGYDDVLCVEVKITPEPVGALLRQITRYRSGSIMNAMYHRNQHWVVALYYDIDESYREALQSQEVIPVRLGPDFDEWARSRQATSRVVSI